ncbi:hypothetical protein N9901_01770 [Flavobacteriaceae bacterium]|nr:hypothetical protein [Flavobacteriaceae bacterium]
MKKPIWIIAVLSILLNITLVYVFVFKGDVAYVNDNRIELNMSNANRDFVLEEMRSFLESVQQINEGVTYGDASKVIQAGETSGGAVIEQTPKGLIKSLPIGFKQLGFSTHDIFDDISESAKEHFNPKETQQKLNSLLNNCVACHQSYKIVTNSKE